MPPSSKPITPAVGLNAIRFSSQNPAPSATAVFSSAPKTGYLSDLG